MPLEGSMIVIADHDPEYLAFIQELLTEEGYQVLVVAVGASAYQTIRQNGAALAILDIPIMQPDAPLVTLRMMRADPKTKHIPVLICSTATISMRDNLHYFQTMGCAVLTKPFDLADMLEHIRVLIDKASTL